MTDLIRKPANKRFEAMRNQIKNTLFEATTDQSSPKTLKQAFAFPDNAPQMMRKLPQKNEAPTADLNPCFEQGKWRKMTEITQKRNFEMMRSNLKVHMFGKTEENEPQPKQTEELDGVGVTGQLKLLPVKKYSGLDITEAKTADTVNDTTPEEKNEEQMVLQSLLPAKNPSNEGKKFVQPLGESSMEGVVIEVTPMGRHVFKKFEFGRKEELGEGSPEDANIFFIENNFNKFYHERETLGEGTSGIVKKCVKVATEEEFAVKIINFKGDDEIKTLVLHEFRNHRRLSHNNIVRVYELYVDTFRNKIYTVMELVRCREMFDVIQELGSFCEADASMTFKQILLAIHYMHSNGVCHRDLKPNNILASNDGKIVKITDFNVSKFIDKTKKQYAGFSKENYKMWTYTGTIAFTAPEVLADTEYTEMVDMWSAGCVLYTMLCGYQPFQAEYLKDLIAKIITATVEYSPEHWSKISPEAKDLLQKLLEKDPKKRLSPSQALLHPWIYNVGKVSRLTIADLTENLKDNARKNSKAACLAGRMIQSSLLPNYKKKKSQNKAKTTQTLEEHEEISPDSLLGKFEMAKPKSDI